MNPFTPFTAEHLAPLAIGVVFTVLVILLGRRNERWRLITTGILAFLNLAAYGYSQAAWLSLDKPVHIDNLLPLHLCDLSAIIAGFALLTRHRLLCALTYCWGLAATVQALITPALGVGHPSWPHITFFIQHFAIVAAALYLPLVDGWRPKRPLWRTPLDALLFGILYQLVSLGCNALLGSNFGFTMHKPHSASLLDHLGPWPWYLMAMWPIAFGLFLLLCLPFAKGTQDGK
ncbi:MAG: TIGR02206 family membrane protein [Akkermansiaceae bacterium]|nr:TIGR02206 family membrane protein [Akkermansiaceae bacterium]